MTYFAYKNISNSDFQTLGNYSSGFLRAQVIFGSTGTRTSSFQIIRLLPLQFKGLEVEVRKRYSLKIFKRHFRIFLLLSF